MAVATAVVVKRPIEPRNRNWMVLSLLFGWEQYFHHRDRLGGGKPPEVAGTAQSRRMDCQETWEGLYFPLNKVSVAGGTDT